MNRNELQLTKRQMQEGFEEEAHLPYMTSGETLVDSN